MRAPLRADYEDMKFVVAGSELKDALAYARSATPTVPSLVAYSGVLFKVSDDGTLAVTGSDGDITIAATVQVDDFEPGEILLLPKPLMAYLSSCPTQGSIAMKVSDGGDVAVSHGDGRPYSFRPVAATFPSAPKTTADEREVDPVLLGSALSAVRNSVARDNPGVQVVSSSKSGVILHATDSYRLSRAEVPNSSFGDFTGVVALSTLEKAAKMGVTAVAVDPVSHVLTFANESVKLTTRLMAGPFPPVETVLDNRPSASCELPTKDMLQALSRLAAVAEDDPVRVRIERNKVVLTAQNIDLGAGTEEVNLPAAADEEVDFLIKIDYLRDALSSPACETATLYYSGPISPFFVHGTSPLAFTHVVMPVRA